MPLQQTSGNVTADAYGGGTAVEPVYIESIFSTYLYSGTSAAQTITNGIDLAGKGGLVWSKGRNQAGYNNCLMDTARSGILFSDTTQAANAYPTDIQSYNADGFTLKAQSSSSYSNIVGTNYASWTFRKQPKFFDVVTYTGDGTNGRNISHSLASTPGVIIIKRTDSTSNWAVAYSPASLWTGESYTGLYLNTTAARGGTTSNGQGISNVSSTNFTVIASGSNPLEFNPNTNGATYVAYLFAHNAGGFGLTGTDNVISCGSYTGGAIPNAKTLGYEPQWIMVKRTDSTGNWVVFDNMRGMAASASSASYLYPNLSNAESSGSNGIGATATGFEFYGTNTDINSTAPGAYIYIAIRRGPMKTPTTGTSVFSPQTTGSASGGTLQTIGFRSDLSISKTRDSASGAMWEDRLRGFANANSAGNSAQLFSSSTNAETTANSPAAWQVWNTTFRQGDYPVNAANVWWELQRAPGFFDEVCWTGNGTGVRVNHNLGVAPELIILKSRSGATNWIVRPPGVANNYLVLNSTAAVASGSGNFINNPTATYFDTGDNAAVNTNGATYVGYLFASCPGVSKVGSYSGTGATQTISCGFAARFVLIKRTDSTGNWFVWDTARGMVAGTDPRLPLNSTAAEVNENWVYTNASGFQIVTTDATVNASGGTYIYLAIA